MTIAEFTQAVTAFTVLIGAIASVVAAIRIRIVHKATNSIVTKLLIEGKAASRAEGIEEGRLAQRNGDKIDSGGR
jgi:hypothetical protein